MFNSKFCLILNFEIQIPLYSLILLFNTQKETYQAVRHHHLPDLPILH